MEQLRIQTGWITNLPTTPLQFSLGFRIDERFWREPIEFAWNGVLVNVQPNHIHCIRPLLSASMDQASKKLSSVSNQQTEDDLDLDI
ncbi:hypothetical protein AVEN_152424-1 [Araneus ventricosus]|uniref:Uncharacterized protein n=1 Tax=Araneus ventricosus TaxID=182803 RepID=A0A4Y2G7P9_ARAVE|nr:hypothetical protein AVEN_152424-1 [Araneus ventricosus]